jgi:hypothetical protein
VSLFDAFPSFISAAPTVLWAATLQPRQVD